MFYKQYGNTDMKVSAIGFGSMRYDDDDVRAGKLEKCAEIALYAHSKGINYFDTAPFYCFDKSEEITGIALSQLKRDSFYLSTKANLNTLKGKTTKQAFRERLELSLSRLKVDYIDFYHLWCMLSLEDYRQNIEALYDFYVEAKKDGLIKNIVFSSHMHGDELDIVLQDNLFKGILLGYNALNYKFRQKGIQTAHKNGMGVVVMNPLGGGVIPQTPEMFKYLEDKQRGFDVATGAINFVASHKEVSVTLVGLSSKQEVDKACLAVEDLQEKSIVDITANIDDSLISNELCTGCSYCLPCPAAIDIPKFMDAYNNRYFGYSILDRLDMHWGLDKNDAKKCIACGACEKRCTQHLPIIERLKDILAQ